MRRNTVHGYQLSVSSDGWQVEIGPDVLGRWHWIITRAGCGRPVSGGTARTRRRCTRRTRRRLRLLQEGWS